MCDYSLTNVKSRPAAVGDKLIVRNFGTGTRGFAEAAYNADGSPGAAQDVAVCVLPGTELAFDAPVESHANMYGEEPTSALPSVAKFAQINKDRSHCHHDSIEFADGRQVLLTYLIEGQRATVLQLPAAPKNDAEREKQTRAEYVG